MRAIRDLLESTAGGPITVLMSKKDQSVVSPLRAEDYVVGTRNDENFIQDKPRNRCEKAPFKKLAYKCSMNS